MRKIWIIVQILFVFLTGTQESFSQQFYVTTGDSVFVVDAGSCKARWLCTMSGTTTQDLASSGNTLYGYSQSNTELYSIDTVHGTVSFVICSVAGMSNSLTCDQQGNFYLANDHYLVEIPASDRWPENIGQFFTYTPAGDLSFLNNHLYLAAKDYYESYLLRIDLNPFTATLIGPMNIGSHWIYGLVTAMYKNKLSLLGTSDENKLYVIDEVTGNATLICNIPVSEMILGAAPKETGTFVPNDPEGMILKIYPTFITDKLTIETENKPKEIFLSILNLNGQEIIKQQILDQITTLDLSALSSGMYLV
jgi:hypothetical protein